MTLQRMSFQCIRSILPAKRPFVFNILSKQEHQLFSVQRSGVPRVKSSGVNQSKMVDNLYHLVVAVIISCQGVSPCRVKLPVLGRTNPGRKELSHSSILIVDL